MQAGIMTWLLGAVLSSNAACASRAQEGTPIAARITAFAAFDEAASRNAASPTTSELREWIERVRADRDSIERRHAVPFSADRRAARSAHDTATIAMLDAEDWSALSTEARVDAALLRNALRHDLELQRREEERLAEAAPLLPFLDTIAALREAQRRLEPLDVESTAGILDGLTSTIEHTRKAVAIERTREAGTTGASAPGDPAGIPSTPTSALRASRVTSRLAATLEEWYDFRAGYDPLFTWWCRVPYGEAKKALDDYESFLRREVVGIQEGEDPPIVGDPIGREEILVELDFEWIPYAPEELMAIAEGELAWCEQEMKRAAAEMGLGDDWRAALERVKQDHVPPGEQPALVRRLAWEAIDFLEARELITIPALAKEDWGARMLSPEAQEESPFFLGGESIHIAFPTDAMEHESKRMSLRGNNVHFSRATVHHELIPGHHLQWFMTSRYMPHRSEFGTPFWTEGWALYWELRLWDLGFPTTPEDRVGMLFWRMHRCARILFSLSFHLGTMTPQECIDFLVERVGHERANATAEVRRSFGGSYGPLYQVGYMIGGMQFRALRDELVGGGLLGERAFHDAVMQGGEMPVELVRARLLDLPLRPNTRTSWRSIGAGK